MSLRSLARGAAEVVITGTGTARIARRLHRSSVAILAYHNVVAPEEAGRGDTSLHLPFPRFADQIARVMKTHDVISLEDLHTAPRGGRPRAVITFDDAYRGAVTLALPELRRLGIPAVMFVSPGMLGTRSTWWDEFGAAGKLSPAVRDDALTRLAGRRDLVSNVEVRAIARGALPASYGIATREELLNACAADIAIGSHAWDHEYLPALNDTALRETLQIGRAHV